MLRLEAPYEHYFQSHGPSRMLSGTPQLDALPTPVQTRVRTGDLILAHYELGHAGAPNLSSAIRYAVFFRLHHRDHDPGRIDVLSDLWRHYAGIRELGLA